MDDSPPDRQPWDERLPVDEDPIVWRRSVPHAGRWPDLRRRVAELEERGYGVRVLVVHRDRFAGVRSQIRWRHVDDVRSGRENVDRAYRHIFAEIEAADVPATLVGYESLVRYPRARAELLRELGLDLEEPPLEIWDANAKWHEAAEPEPVSMGEAGESWEPTAPTFPDGWFVCRVGRWERYERRVARGRRRMARLRAVFCGLARNAEPALERLLPCLERAGRLFADFRVVALENDSADRTRELLEARAATDPRIAVIGEDLGWPVLGAGRNPARMRALAKARNRVLDHVAASFSDFDVAIVLDFDLEQGFSEDGLACTFGLDGWDAMASNGLYVEAPGGPMGKPRFWDVWALRFPGEDEPRPAEGKNRLLFERGQEPVAVDSAFGGLAVYRMEAFLCGARYSGDDCEHVAFHREMRDRGFERQFLNPSQIVLYGSPKAGDSLPGDDR